MKYFHNIIKYGMPVILAGVAFLGAAALLSPLLAPYAAAYRSAMGAAEGAGALRDALPEYDSGDARVQGFLQSLAKKEATIAQLESVEVGQKFATLRIESVGIDAPVYFGDTPELLTAGIGTYAEGGLPGQGRTILMGGHNNTDFLTLPKAEIGAVIEIEADYGVFRYRITDAKELRFDDPAALDLAAPEENIVLYTCTRSIPGGATPWRWFVYGQPVAEKSEVTGDE